MLRHTPVVPLRRENPRSEPVLSVRRPNIALAPALMGFEEVIPPESWYSYSPQHPVSSPMHMTSQPQRPDFCAVDMRPLPLWSTVAPQMPPPGYSPFAGSGAPMYYPQSSQYQSPAIDLSALHIPLDSNWRQVSSLPVSGDVEAPDSPRQTEEERLAQKRKDKETIIDSVIVFANGAIQIGLLTTGVIANFGSGGVVGTTGGIIMSVLVGGRLSLYIVEIAEKVIKTIHKVNIKDEDKKAEIIHIEDALDVINKTLKGVIQMGQFTTIAVTSFLSTSNWVARYITGPILSTVATVELLVLGEEIGLNIYETMRSRNGGPVYKIPYYIEKANSIIRGIIQIIAISSLAAASWVSQNQIVAVIGYVRTGLAALRTTTFMAEIASIFLHLYWKSHPVHA